MVPNLKSIRPLDAAIAAAAVALVAVSAYLGVSVWSHNRSVEKSAPLSRAVEELRGLIRKNPNDIDLRMQLAQAFTAAGRDSEAQAQYEQILKLSKNHVAAITGLGFIAAKQRDWPGAEEYFRRAVSIMEAQPTARMSKQFETANYYLGTALLEQKKYEDAVGYFKEALRVNRSASDTHFLLAHAYQGLEADEEYKAELEYALAFDPLMPEANYEYGKVLLEEGDVAGAAQHFRVAADKAPARPEPQEELDRLGSADERIEKAQSLADEDPEAALVEARVAVAIEPKGLRGLMLLGKLYEQTGDDAAAADAYKAVLAIDSDNADATSALKRVDNGK